MNASPWHSPKICVVHSAQVDFVTWAASFTGFAVLLVSVSATWSIAHLFSASIAGQQPNNFSDEL